MSSLLATLQQWEWFGILLARLAVGLLFAISGGGKLFVPKKGKQMKETMQQADVPAAQKSAVFVSLVELVFGVFLILGFLTPLSSLMLSGVMVVAIATVKLKTIEAKSILRWLGEFLYIPEVLYLVILIWLFFSGPGRVSLDNLLF